MKSTLAASLLLTASMALPTVAQEAATSEDDTLPADEQVLIDADAVAVEEGDEVEQLSAAINPIDMDRTAWPTIVVTPEDGSVTHNPHYMGNVPMGEDEVGPLDAPDPVWQIQEALRGADAGNYNGENLSALGAQPFIGLAQFVLIPVRAVFEYPWSEVTSP